MTAALPEAVRRAGTSIEIRFQDEARVGQQGTLTYVWAEKGSRPRALKGLRYEWAYLFGAVCAERGVGAALVLPRANTHAMTLHHREAIPWRDMPQSGIKGRDQPPGRARRPCRAGLRRHELAQDQWAPARAGQHHPAAPAPLQPGVEPGREHLGVSPRQQPQQQRVRHLRHHPSKAVDGHCGPVLHRLELAHGRPRPHPLPRNHAMDQSGQSIRHLILCRRSSERRAQGYPSHGPPAPCTTSGTPWPGCSTGTTVTRVRQRTRLKQKGKTRNRRPTCPRHLRLSSIPPTGTPSGAPVQRGDSAAWPGLVDMAHRGRRERQPPNSAVWSATI